jgi:hypothetical protein
MEVKVSDMSWTLLKEEAVHMSLFFMSWSGVRIWLARALDREVKFLARVVKE